ncbi:hypothetical protein GSI_08145 [Ganoderma sinense ZZ0214-1]|uniref:Uncharacterized protein n=1 Tax=Ganoderma sinense ZZ0214-1 TaxID=1077348 RepID=A0A2G8S7K2_9APHY|nr:hypothetical protein GSI_08145 [Ganoderma sinense ZZ0214-1]
MQRYTNPEVFLCPYYNVPGISNPKMHMAKEGLAKSLPPSPDSAASPQDLTTLAPVQPSASTQSPSPSSSRDNSLSPEPSSPVPDAGSDSDRKKDDYERIFEELIDAE